MAIPQTGQWRMGGAGASSWKKHCPNSHTPRLIQINAVSSRCDLCAALAIPFFSRDLI
jgi:hypothetical protein